LCLSILLNILPTYSGDLPFVVASLSSFSSLDLSALACLSSCVSDIHPKLYEDYTAGYYLDERLREIGLKK
jgi:hypothetical protein